MVTEAQPGQDWAMMTAALEQARASLVISQVVLSFGIPFALVPLVALTRRPDIMGALVNWRITTFAAAGAAGLIIAMNVYLLAVTFAR